MVPETGITASPSYKYKISSTEYEVSIVIEASKYIKQGDIIL
jgi:hypothetical protein